ncbi:phage baseplate protein [Peptostreptococcus faecalis]|uniref:phage baseplate protein n=1 Tax=Peptostreptococcus faecalis TaxID=2045015 RepID=UPI000C7C2AB0|nr:hypothetical protein [Peptostreptococcus faecalis]
MYFFFIDGYKLPITPSKLNVKIGNNNKTIELANGGDINLIKCAKLTEYSFSFLLPFRKYSYSTNGAMPREILEALKKIKQEKRIVEFEVHRKMGNETRFSTYEKVSIEDYEIVEDADNNSDITVDITLKEFRPYKTIHLIDPKKKREENNGGKDEKKKAESVPCHKQLEIIGEGLGIRQMAGVWDGNPQIDKFVKGEKPFAYAEFMVDKTPWYKVKHSKLKGGWGWISGNPAYTKVLKNLTKAEFDKREFDLNYSIDTKLHSYSDARAGTQSANPNIKY